MKRVLVISYYWPPNGGSGVQRWVKMCKYLPDYGWEPVVYTPENPALTSTDTTLAADVSPDLEVIRHPILEPGQFTKKATSAQVNPINAQKKSFKQRVAMWIRGNCFIPDPRVMWVRPSVKFLSKYLKEHPVDAIISTGPPHSMHLIARALAGRTGTPWLADFRDPWTRMFYFKHLSLTSFSAGIHRRLEQSVIDEATGVIAVSPLVQKDFEQATATPVHLVTNGFDKDDFASYPDNAGNGDEFTILHAGLFAADGNPTSLWEALGELCDEVPEFRSRLRLVLCGKTDKAIVDAIAKAGLEANCTDLGYLDHVKVVRQMMQTSMLILPLRKEPEYKATLPGKLFEYLASSRPIMGIGQTDGAMASILASTKAGFTYEWDDKAGMKAKLSEWFELFRNKSLVGTVQGLEDYSRDSLAEKIANILNRIAK